MSSHKASYGNSFLTEYTRVSGQTIILPDGFKLKIQETSQSVYQIYLIDDKMRSVSNVGTDLDKMVDKAIEDLTKMRSK